MTQSNGFARGGLDGPPRQWQVALRRLPLTLAILIFVGGTAAGLAYVASGSSSKGVEAVFVNDVGETVLYGGCDESDCKKGGALSPQQLGAGQRQTVRLALGQGGNPILILTPEGKRIGCFFLTYDEKPTTTPVIRFSTAVAC